MAIVAFTGSTGAPGTTTAALGMLLTWPLPSPEHKVILIEASPDGGRIAAGMLEGQTGGRWSLYNLAASIYQHSLRETFQQQVLDIGGVEPGRRRRSQQANPTQARRFVLPGLRGPAQLAATEPVWEPLATLCSALQQSATDVLIDLGRNGPFGSPAVLALSADVVVVVVRRRMASIDDAAARVEALRPVLAEAGNADALRLLVVGDGPYDKDDIARQLRIPLLAEVPYSTRYATPLSDGPANKIEMGSILMRSYRSAAHAAAEAVTARRARLYQPGYGANAGGVR